MGPSIPGSLDLSSTPEVALCRNLRRRDVYSQRIV
jgi:hypothetical protein